MCRPRPSVDAALRSAGACGQRYRGEFVCGARASGLCYAGLNLCVAFMKLAKGIVRSGKVPRFRLLNDLIPGYMLVFTIQC